MAQTTQGEVPPTFQAGPATAGQLCSICQTAILSGEQVLTCPHCSLPFHADCWGENRGCSAYGCKGAPRTTKASAPMQQVSNAWGDEKPCPACGKSIKAEALKCRFCGAAFSTRDVITREQYTRREYEEQEFAAARNKLIVLFLLSAAGCFAPLGVLLCGLLVRRGELLGIDYRRLPSALRAVVWSAIGVGSLLMVILAALLVFDR